MRYSEYTEFEKVNVFGIGFPNDAFAQYFIGKSYLNPLMKLGKTDISIAGSPRTVSWDFYTRTGLTLAQRELITFCFLAAQGGCEPQLTARAKGEYEPR